MGLLDVPELHIDPGGLTSLSDAELNYRLAFELLNAKRPKVGGLEAFALLSPAVLISLAILFLVVKQSAWWLVALPTVLIGLQIGIILMAPLNARRVIQRHLETIAFTKDFDSALALVHEDCEIGALTRFIPKRFRANHRCERTLRREAVQLGLTAPMTPEPVQ